MTEFEPPSSRAMAFGHKFEINSVKSCLPEKGEKGHYLIPISILSKLMITLFFFYLASFPFSRAADNCSTKGITPSDMSYLKNNDRGMTTQSNPKDPNFFIRIDKGSGRRTGRDARPKSLDQGQGQSSAINRPNLKEKTLIAKSTGAEIIPYFDETNEPIEEPKKEIIKKSHTLSPFVQSLEQGSVGQEPSPPKITSKPSVITEKLSFIREQFKFDSKPKIQNENIELMEQNQSHKKITSKPSVITRKLSFILEPFKFDSKPKIQPESLELIEENFNIIINSIPIGSSDYLRKIFREGIFWCKESENLVWEYFSKILEMKEQKLLILGNLGSVFHIAFLRFNAHLHELSKQTDQNTSYPYSFGELEGGAKFCYYLWPFWEYNKFRKELIHKGISLSNLYDHNYVLLIDLETKLEKDEQQKNQTQRKKWSKADEAKFLKRICNKFIENLSQLKEKYPKDSDAVNRYAGTWITFAKVNYELGMRQEEFLSSAKNSKSLLLTKTKDAEERPYRGHRYCKEIKNTYLLLYKKLEKKFPCDNN
jgi:hypothetical protein